MHADCLWDSGQNGEEEERQELPNCDNPCITTNFPRLHYWCIIHPSFTSTTQHAICRASLINQALKMFERQVINAVLFLSLSHEADQQSQSRC